MINITSINKNSFFFLVAVLVANMFVSVSALGQFVVKEASVSITGEVRTPLVLRLADMEKLSKTKVVAKDRNDKTRSYEGVELSSLLGNAGVSLGEQLRGENLVKYLLVEAIDGYQVLFSLAEVDPAFTSRKIILAYKKDGVMLPADEGPFQIVIEGEKRKSRYARQVISLKIVFAK
jgi:hypothetical protein